MRGYAYIFGMLAVVAGFNALCSNGWWQHAYGILAGVLVGVTGTCWRRSFTEREE